MAIARVEKKLHYFYILIAIALTDYVVITAVENLTAHLDDI